MWRYVIVLLSLAFIMGCSAEASNDDDTADVDEAALVQLLLDFKDVECPDAPNAFPAVAVVLETNELEFQCIIAWIPFAEPFVP